MNCLSKINQKINNSPESHNEEHNFPVVIPNPLERIINKVITANNLESWFNQYNSKKIKVKFDEIKTPENNLVVNVYKNVARRVNVEGTNKFAYQRVNLKMNNAIRPCSSIKINIISSDNKKKRMMLPETLLSSLLNLLSEQRNKEMCCYDFVSILFNKFKMMSYFNIFDWVISNEYQAGDAIALRSNLKNSLGYNYEHYAVCLGEDIYMSLLGKGNCIHFTTLEEMKKIYDDTEVVGLKLITPKKEII